ncbi:hypothetical protein BC833DRAFT_561424 [Globomyces pollinis-pini]|nr:hypothetical protein BC833DRAFT_561424 [Globomyces pollinis-pini]KAJ2998310.1 hypothetical protein HDV02_004624 [Globomyces sp. JEL0801]
MCGPKHPDGPVATSSVAPLDKKVDNNQKRRQSIAVGAVVKRVPTRKFLDAVLANDSLRQCLETFLTAEFCAESLHFIMAIDNYIIEVKKLDLEKDENRLRLVQLRDTIMKNFLLPTSETEVNIPAKMKRECLITMEQLKGKGASMELDDYTNLSLKLFDGPSNHVKHTLITERIGRFQTTPLFLKASEGISGI